MKLKINEIGLITIMVGAIAIASVVHNSSNPIPERVACAATEVFRWSDQACYAPQGE